MAFSLSIYIYFTVPNIAVALVNIILNCFLIHALRKLKKLQNISHKLFVSLSISDICIGLSLLITEPAYWFVGENHVRILRVCSGILLFTFCQFSALSILLVAIDRYIHMRYLNKYHSIMNNRRAVMLVITNIILTMASTVTTVTGSVYGFGLIGSLVPSLGLLGVLTFITIVYMKAYRSLRRRTLSITLRRRDAVDLGHTLRSDAIIRRNPNQEFSKSILFVLGSLWVFYTPTAAFTAASNAEFVGDDVLICFYTALLLVYINCSVNVVIFISFNRQLRNYALQRLGCRSSANVRK